MAALIWFVALPATSVAMLIVELDGDLEDRPKVRPAVYTVRSVPGRRDSSRPLSAISS